MMSIATGPWKLFRDQAEHGSGIGLKLFGFIAESVFTIIPESSSGSLQNTVRNHPGNAFTFDRIPQPGHLCAADSLWRTVHLELGRPRMEGTGAAWAPDGRYDGTMTLPQNPDQPDNFQPRRPNGIRRGPSRDLPGDPRSFHTTPCQSGTMHAE